MSILGDFARWIQSMLQAEPVLTLAVAQSGIAMAVGFGLDWSGEQVALTTAFFAAMLGWVARREVSPITV